MVEPFTTTSGVRQGCVLAPALFCRAIDFVMERVSRKVGIQVGQYTFTDIDYADDVALLVDKEESYHTALTAMDEEASKFGLHVSWTKTKLQNLGSGSTPSPIIVMAPRPGLSYKLIGKDWIPYMYDANDASCTSAGTTSCPTTTF